MSASGKLPFGNGGCYQRPVWAGHVSYVAVRPRLCKARYLRIAATREHAPHDRCQPKVTL